MLYLESDRSIYIYPPAHTLKLNSRTGLLSASQGWIEEMAVTVLLITLYQLPSPENHPPTIIIIISDPSEPP